MTNIEATATSPLRKAVAALRASDVARANPFVTMHYTARYLVILYFVLWRILPDLAGVLQLDEVPNDSLLVARFVASTTLNLLLLAPFFWRRFAGTPVGWLHPLVLPTLLVIVKDLLKSPESLLMPVLAWFMAPVIPDYELLQGMPLTERLTVELKRDVLLIIAQASYLAGFALYAQRPRIMHAMRQWGVCDVRILAVIAASFGLLIYFIQVNGGLVAHFSGLALGRFQMRETSGHFLVAIGLLPYYVLLWYAFKPRLLRQPWFLLLFIAAVAAQFAATGSRSNMLLPVVTLLSMWIWINGKVPVLRVAALGLAAFFALGLLGELRTSALGNKATAGTSVLSNFDLGAAALRTREEAAEREAISGQIAIVQKVPGDVPYLLGTSYISSIAFFVPRSVWPAKPRGPGAHVAAIIVERRPDTVGYEGQSLPAGGMGEAYWNFGVPGIVIVFTLFGLFHRLIAQRFLQQPADPFMALVMMTAVVALPDIDSDSIVGFLQRLVLLYVVYRFVRRGVAHTDDTTRAVAS